MLRNALFVVAGLVLLGVFRIAQRLGVEMEEEGADAPGSNSTRFAQQVAHHYNRDDPGELDQDEFTSGQTH